MRHAPVDRRWDCRITRRLCGPMNCRKGRGPSLKKGGHPRASFDRASSLAKKEAELNKEAGPKRRP